MMSRFNSRDMSHEEASRYYSNLIQLEPDSGFAYPLCGHVSRALGDFDQAIEDFSAVIGIYGMSLNDNGRWSRGMVLLEDKKEFDKALADFDECSRINPQHGRSHIGRGITHRLLSQRLRCAPLPVFC